MFERTISKYADRDLVEKALSQLSPNSRKLSGKVLHDRSRKQTYVDPDEIGTVGLSEL
jgi:hypothetical protein